MTTDRRLEDVVTDPYRLAAVRQSGLLDTAPEEAFDAQTRLAARVLRAPAAFISIVDADRDFYKSCVGFSEPLATTRQLRGRTLCHHALVSDGPLVVPDTLADTRFRIVPTVESLGVRAYLGVPLRTADGLAIGGLCAIDLQPRDWTPEDVDALATLAAATMREIELRAALREAERRDRQKDVFVATLAHELRQPLGALAPALSLLRAQPADPAIERVRDVMERQVMHLQQLVEELLDTAAVTEGKVTLRRERADLRRPIADAAEQLHEAFARHSHTVSLTLPDEPVSVCVDVARMQQVFSNLLGNAVKYTPDGGRIDVTVTVTAGADVVIASVRDNGHGIDPAMLPHVFEMFVQEAREHRRGLGIGLALVRRIVGLHGGAVVALSEGVGRGSEFVVTLPLDRTS